MTYQTIGFKNENGGAFILDIKKARLNRLQRNLYNFGTGVMQENPNFKALLITLTYKNADDWQPNHIRDFLKTVRTHLWRKKTKLVYAWVAELQKRGAMHYHIIVFLPKNISLPKVGVGKKRAGWWTHGFADQKYSRTGIGYLLKYVSKNDTKHEYPKGARIFGLGGCSSDVKSKINFYNKPQYVLNNFQGFTYKDVDIKRVSSLSSSMKMSLGLDKFSGFVCLKTGVLVQSEYFVCFSRGKVYLFTVNNRDDSTLESSLNYHSRVLQMVRDVYEFDKQLTLDVSNFTDTIVETDENLVEDISNFKFFGED